MTPVNEALLRAHPLPDHNGGGAKEARGTVLVIGGSVEVPGGALLAEEALAAKRLAENGNDAAARTAIARFFAENLAVQASGLERTVVEGADSVNRADAALA